MKKVYYSNELTHWGIKGQKWGVRRYQNEDGTLTEAGKRRYAKDIQKQINTASREMSRSVARSASLSRSMNIVGLRKDKAEFNGNHKRLEKLTNKYNKMKDLLVQDVLSYNKNKNIVHSMIKKLESDPNYVYRSYPVTYLNNKWIGNQSYYQSATGTKYSVRQTTDKRKNKARWNINKRQYSINPIRTETYYYYV